MTLPAAAKVLANQFWSANGTLIRVGNVDQATGQTIVFLVPSDPNYRYYRIDSHLLALTFELVIESKELRTPDEWVKLLGHTILDPDGWRGENGRPWTDPISYEEYTRRYSKCTVQIIDEEGTKIKFILDSVQ